MGPTQNTIAATTGACRLHARACAQLGVKARLEGELEAERGERRAAEDTFARTQATRWVGASGGCGWGGSVVHGVQGSSPQSHATLQNSPDSISHTLTLHGSESVSLLLTLVPTRAVPSCWNSAQASGVRRLRQ